MARTTDLPRFDHTFSDEWGAPDLILTRSEAATVRRAAEKFGIKLNYTPTGRTNQVILKACMDLALAKMAEARNAREFQQWRQVAKNARRAIAQFSFAGSTTAKPGG